MKISAAVDGAGANCLSDNNMNQLHCALTAVKNNTTVNYFFFSEFT